MDTHVFQTALRTSVVLGLRLVVQAASLLIVARLLGPGQYGAFAGIAALAVMLSTLSSFGMHLILLGKVSKEPSQREKVLSLALPTTLLCGAFLLLIFVLLCRFGLLEYGAVSLLTLVCIGLADIIVQPLCGLLAAQELALERTELSQLLLLMPLAFRLIIAFVLLVVDVSDPLAIYSYGYLAATCIAFGATTYLAGWPWPEIKNWQLPNLPIIKESAGYAVMNVTGNIPAELDKVLAVKLLSPLDGGLYSAGARVIGASTLPVGAIILAMLPRFFRDGSRMAATTRNLFSRVIFGTAILSVFLAAFLWAAAGVLSLILGSDYKSIDGIIRCLCLAVPGLALRTTIGNMLMTRGKPWLRSRFEVLGLLAMAVASIVLVPDYGILGMAYAFIFSEWTMAIVAFLMMRVVRTNNSSCGD